MEGSEVNTSSRSGRLRTRKRPLHENNNSDMSIQECPPNGGVKSPENKKYAYTPVDFTWRRKWLTKFGWEDQIEDEENNPYKELNCFVDRQEIRYGYRESPFALEYADPDGNCFFKAVSKMLTAGNDALHVELREKICTFMETHQDTFMQICEEKKRPISTEKQFQTYMERMRTIGEWASQAEVLAFATMTQTTVATFLEDHWEFYRPRFALSIDQTKTDEDDLAVEEEEEEKVFYLQNVGTHFSPVVSVPTRITYELSAVIIHKGGSTDNGHYVTYFRAKNDKWIHCDDETIAYVGEDEAMEKAKDGYIFFYTKSEIKWHFPTLQ